MEQVRGYQHLFGRDYVVMFDSSLNDPTPVETWVRYRQDNSGLYVARIPYWVPPSAPVTPPPSVSIPLEWLGSPDVTLDRTGSHKLNRMERSMMASAESKAAARLRRWIPLLALPGARARLGIGPAVGSLPGEVVFLKFPMVPGQSWVYDPLASEKLIFSVTGPAELTLPPGRFLGYRLDNSNEPRGPRDYADFWIGPCGILKQDLRIEEPMYDSAGHEVGAFIQELHSRLDSLDLNDRSRCGR